MKKSIITIASMLLILGCSGQKTTSSTTTNDTITQEMSGDEMMTGAYSEAHEPTEEDLALFNSTYKGEIELTPHSVSTQVVAGTNYVFTCRDKEGKMYIVTIFVPLPCNQDTQKTEVTSVREEK